MRINRIGLLVAVVLGFLLAPAWADAQLGSITGVCTSRSGGDVLPGVTVVATSPALAQEQVAITDETGTYTIVDLPPGVYTVTFYYADVTMERTGIVVAAGKRTPVLQKLDDTRTQGETIEIRDSAPTIDPTSTTQGITITQDYLQNIPISTSTPDEAPGTEGYSRIDDNPFKQVTSAPLSTFSIDVDTASYSNVRRFLTAGQLPPADAVRVEELLNYFPYDYPAPTGHIPFTVSTEVGPSPWNPAYKLVRIGLQSRALEEAKAPPQNLVFLVDVSGSMEDPNKLPLLKAALGLLVGHLRVQDRIAIVTYAGETSVVLPSTGGKHWSDIHQALDSLGAGGGTNGGAGIELAYQEARSHFIQGGTNRVILCTDGDFNVGLTSEGELTRLIEEQRDHDVFLTVLGFGMGNLKDDTMEQLADRGNGNYAYIDSLAEARKVLVAEAGSTLTTVAKDVKLQLEFNPATVAGYRLLGYEDRLLADQDFNDDTKDAGELGAGHAVTALYEVVPAGGVVPAPSVDPLRYQTVASASPGTQGPRSNELMTVKVRFKPPTEKQSKLFSIPIVNATPSLAQTTTDFRWAAAVAGYGMLLHGSPYRGQLSWLQVHALAAGALGADPHGYRHELLTLIDMAAKLTAAQPAPTP